MDLIVQQKVFSLKDRFYITTPEGENVYAVEGKVVSISHKLFLYDMTGTEVANIHKKPLSLMYKYMICHGEEEVAELRQKFGFTMHFICDELGWDIQGNFMSCEFNITKNGETVATVDRKMFSIGDHYHLYVAHDEDVLNALCVVLAIDDVLLTSAASASATASATITTS